MKTAIIRAANWFLEGVVDDSEGPRQFPINVWPFRVGRRPGLSLCLSSNSVSKEHAEILAARGQLWVHDLNSRNGTFVNGARIEGEVPLEPYDVIHFANVEFRLMCEAGAGGGATLPIDRSEWIFSVSQFDKLFEPRHAVPHFQPIISLPQGRTHGYEVLARSGLDGLKHPHQMFDAAARLNMEGKLSAMFRHRGVEVGRRLPGNMNLFLNTHPAELGTADLLAALGDLRAMAPRQPLTLEIHEAAITDLYTMRKLYAALKDLDIQLAYDDFGSGQARLVDLIEIPPDYLKFDIVLVRDIHLAKGPRKQTLETLVRMAHDLGVAVLAEGVECEAEADACTQLGFDFAQGYYFGRPAAAESYAAK